MTAPSVRSEAGLAPLAVIDLLNDLDSLARLLRTELERGSWLNAYLLVSGISQVAEDYLQADRHLFRKAGEHLRAASIPLGSAGSRVAFAADSWNRAGRRVWSQDRIVEGWLSNLVALVDHLAIVILTGEPLRSDAEAIRSDGRRVLDGVNRLPRKLRRAVIRLPSCFRSFDQQPADMERLAGKFAAEGCDPATPVAVVGVRTSGSYLGPLVAASIKQLGFHDVTTLTMRPGCPLGPRERAILKRIERSDGTVVVVDDPPTTGGSLNKAAESLLGLGIRPDAVILLVPLPPGVDKPPETIRRHRCLLLPWHEWSIHDLLAEREVADSLSRMIDPRKEVVRVERAGEGSTDMRGHIQRRYQATLLDRESGKPSRLDLHVGGVGLGYFGEHSLAIARKVRDFVPHIYGYDHGLLFREWLPEASRFSLLSQPGDQSAAWPFVEYVLARSVALRVPDDTARRLRGRLPAWEAVSNLLSHAFGRAWAWARIPLIDPVVNACLAVSAPSVIDGSMGPNRWFATSAGGARSLIKIDFDRRAFANLDLACYDPVFDLASVAADMELATLAQLGGPLRQASFREQYEEAGGHAVSAERWFLLQLLHLWDRLRLSDGSEPDLRRCMSRTAQRYFAEIFFQGIGAAGDGPLCALDVDGVLESEIVGTSTLTSSSAVALQALLRHGYRPVLMTGRSLSEVIDRCAAFNLAGGVAEYGSVIYDHARQETTEIISAPQARDLARTREAIGRLPGIQLDHAYRRSIRAYRMGAGGERHPPALDLIEQTLAGLDLTRAIEVITGDSQVDLVAAGVNKGAALAALANRMAAGSAAGAATIALAVGDGAPDISAFPLARLAFAPKHADRAVRDAAGKTAPYPYQAGLGYAVGQVLGHRPGSCPECKVPLLPGARSDLLTLISAQERGKLSMAAASMHLAVRAGRRRRESRSA